MRTKLRKSRTHLALAALAMTMGLSTVGVPTATAVLTGDPVPGSVQQVYHAGGPSGIPSTAIPICTEIDPIPGCYDGEMLTIQAKGIGQKAAEPTIGIHPDGTAVMAGSTLVVDTSSVWGVAKTDARRSTDGGMTWTSIQPAVPVVGERIPPGNADPMVYVDTATGRFFTFDLTGACQWLNYSDDKGATWVLNPLACGDVPVDHQTIVAAKPRTLPPHPLYQNFLYYCTNRLVETACGRSMDGGLTWVRSGNAAYGVGNTCVGLSGHLENDPEGRIYLPSGNCTNPWISRSEDDGQSWTRVKVSTLVAGDSHTSVASDKAGNLYYVFVESGTRLPYLVTSTDKGTTWSAPLMIAPPGVRQANFPVVAGGDAGKIAISFPSTTGAASVANRPWTETVVISTDALSGNPTFLSANTAPADPIHRGTCSGRCAGLWDFIDIQISKAGEAWVATSDDCLGSCNTGTTSAAHVGDGIAVKQIGGPSLRANGY